MQNSQESTNMANTTPITDMPDPDTASTVMPADLKEFLQGRPDANTPEENLPPSVLAKWERIGTRLKNLNRMYYLGCVFCLAMLATIEFIPTSNSHLLAWFHTAAQSIFSSLLGVAIIAVIFDYYDISNEFSYLKHIISELLELNEAQDKASRSEQAALLRAYGIDPTDKEAVDAALAPLIKAKYDLSESTTDSNHVDSFLTKMDDEFRRLNVTTKSGAITPRR